MQALNKQERKSAFFSFLIFYIITTAIIIFGVFFGTRLPLYQNEILQSKVSSFERSKVVNDNFTQKMNVITSLLDSVNKTGVQSNLIDGQINQKLSELQSYIELDSTYSKQLYRQTVAILYNRKDDKELLRLSANTASNNMEKDKIINDLKSKISEYSNALNNCQNQLIQLSR